ncbi:MAG TPA: trigger factor [Chitinophagaceae bacterium]|nr:trigger factor [Chitinophagaceae bacterium]
MATITKENIGLLHEKLTVKLEKTDYLPSFEKALKEYSKKANIPGFRKGMVPAGVIKKMYGPSLFTDEVLKSVDRELINYLQKDNLDIFAQPLPLETDIRQLDVNNPVDYTFHFEIGMKPDFRLPELGKAIITRHVVKVTDEMIDNEVTRLQNRNGNTKDQDTVSSEENILNIVLTETDDAGNEKDGGAKKDNSILVKYFSESFRNKWMGKKIGESEVASLKAAFDDKEREWIISDLGLKEDASAADKNFKIEITKIGLLEKRELNEEFFNQLYPNQNVVTEGEFRSKVKDEIQAYWNGQAMNQIHDQVFHELVDHTSIDFPEGFLKKWVKTQGETPKTDEEVEAEFPKFLSQLKWTLISDKIVQENNIQVGPDEIRNFAKQQLFSYMGGANLGDDQPWVDQYVEKMMKDRKYVEESYNRIQTQKIFEWAAAQVKPADKEISAEEFTKMVEEHQHHHH